MSKILSISLLSLIITLSGCAAITITESGQSNFQYRPDYEESKHFFLWGLIGSHHIDVTKICTDSPTIQMQSKYSGWDVLYTALTAGLYSPRTAIVWCEKEGDA